MGSVRFDSQEAMPLCPGLYCVGGWESRQTEGAEAWEDGTKEARSILESQGHWRNDGGDWMEEAGGGVGWRPFSQEFDFLGCGYKEAAEQGSCYGNRDVVNDCSVPESARMCSNLSACSGVHTAS